MKKRILLAVCSVFLTLTACGGAESEVETGVAKEPIAPAENVTEVQKEVTESEDVITNDQALEAIKNYCYINNPDLESLSKSEDVTVYFDVSTSDAGEIVVLYRSYTGAQIRYYVNPTSGDVYVTELVPGIIDDEQKTDETFNIRDYMNGSVDTSYSNLTGSNQDVARADGERFEDVIWLEGMEEPVKYEHAVNNALGFEIDFDYESFVRRSEADKEMFISVYDDINNPGDYLEVEYRPENIDTVTASISDELSKEYEISTDTYELDKAGNCTRIDASACIGGKEMPERLKKVYIVPAGEGTLVGTAHYFIDAAEGFGRRFDYMINTLSIIG